MRILLAIDGSRSSDRARDLVAALPLQQGDRIRIVSVAPVVAGSVTAPGTVDVRPDPDVPEDDVLRSHRLTIESAEREIRSTHSGLSLRSVLVRGRPATVIVDQARKMETDLIVIGHRGLGAWEAILLGSVSAEVVDRAPCPVLVVRDERLGPVILADDGSPHARAAEAVVAAWPILSGLDITVATVLEEAYPYASAVAPLHYTETMTGYAATSPSERRTTADECKAAAARLHAAGFKATPEVLDGDPAYQLLASALEHEAGLLIVGTRGQSGRRGQVLGSVASRVLIHAPCSVLVVREGARLDGHRLGLRREEREIVSAFG